jgi:hypothetical protein
MRLKATEVVSVKTEIAGEVEIRWFDMSINFKETCCIRIWLRYNSAFTQSATYSATPLSKSKIVRPAAFSGGDKQRDMVIPPLVAAAERG